MEPTLKTTPLLISARELAELLGVSLRTIWRLESAGKLPESVYLGSSKRWSRQAIEEWIRDGCPARRRSA
ncbi:MAG: helix-turn-helix domain-containing protein [Planctomycetota bacterium]